MIAAMDIPRFSTENIYMCKPIKNKIMSGGLFSRIIYSSDTVSMNGIYITFNLTGNICEIFPSKFKIQFTSDNSTTKSYALSERTSEIIKSLCEIEHNILTRISIPGKTPLYKLRDQLRQNNFKFFSLTDNISGTPHNIMHTNSIGKGKDTQMSCQNGHFILKISGCWTTPVSYGITYKFSRVMT